MRPKGKLFALVVLFAAVGLLTATGAFTTVEADRTADVTVAGDSAALLQLEPANNSEFANVNSAGELEISLNTSSNNAQADATGVNSNATTLDDNVFNVTNNGQENIYLQVNAPAASNAEVAFYNASNTDGFEGGSAGTSLGDQSVLDSSTLDVSDRYLVNGTNSASRIQINSGNTVMIGIYIQTEDGLNSGPIFDDSEITITAESTEA
jgi:hypothetical protein